MNDNNNGDNGKILIKRYIFLLLIGSRFYSGMIVLKRSDTFLY